MDRTTGENPRSGTLVGRGYEEAVLDACIEAVRGGESRIVALSGDPGMGKSSLLAALGHRARAAGLRVLAGRVGEFERTIPFGVFVDALDDLWSQEHEGRYPLHRDLRVLLEDLAGEHGLVLVLDDLHWADTGSIELVNYLVRHPPAAGVLVACAYRPRQLPLRLRDRIDQSDSVEHLQLGPLGLDDAALLLGMSPARCRPVHEASGGNPFYLEALGRGDELPQSVHAAFKGELDALAPDTRRLLQIAAVTADPFEPDVVAEIADLTLDEALAHLDELTSADLVRLSPDLRTYCFRHPTVRHIAYHSAVASVRHGLHRRAAAVLESRGASPEARAHHVERSAQRGDEHAIAVLTAAAHGAIGRAPDTAAHWFEVALTLAGRQVTDLLWGRARALGLSGKLAESRQVLHELLAALPSDSDERLRVVAFCAHVERALGRHAEVRALASRELAAMADHDSVPAAVLKLVLAVSQLQVLGSPAPIRGLVADILAVAEKHGSPVLGAGAHAVGAMLELDDDSVDRHGPHLRTAAAAVDGATDGEIAERIEAVVWLGWSELRLGWYDEALRHYERATAVAKSTGQHHVLPNLLLGRANSLRWLGCLDDAAVGAEEAAEVAALTGSGGVQAVTLAVHAWTLILKGDAVGGLEIARRAVEAARSVEGWNRTIAQLRVGHAYLAAGDFERALEELDAADLDPELSKVPLPYRPEMYELLVQACLGAGRPAEAATWAGLATNTVTGLGLPGCVGFADLAWAQVHLACGAYGDAVVRANAAAKQFGLVGQRLEVGRAHLVAGLALTAQGSDATADLRRARTVFAACGAQQLLRETNAAFDVPSAPSTPSALATLTRRERQVAQLVGEGATNRQVARRLEMAEKTVEGHLSRIFGKLEVQSRAALAHLLATATVAR